MDKFVFTQNPLDLTKIKNLFQTLGGEFLWEIEKIAQNALEMEGLIFDWDGVFSDGRKDRHRNSTYSELDTMGINMLRFGYWIQTKKILPILIVTGEENPTAWFVAERDRFLGVYYGIKNKGKIDDRIRIDHAIDVSRCIFFFDDILDFALLRKCAFGIALKNNSMPLLLSLIREEPSCAYITQHGGSGHGIREACELILGLSGYFEVAMENRTLFTPLYQDYLRDRNKIEPRLFV